MLDRKRLPEAGATVDPSLRSGALKPLAGFHLSTPTPISYAPLRTVFLHLAPGALLRRNTNLIKDLRVQFKAYQNSPTKHEVWLRFQGYTKLIVLGGRGAKDDPATDPAA